MLTAGLIALYVLVVFAIALIARGGADHKGFLIGGRKIGVIPTVASIAAGFRDGGGMLVWITLGIGFGIGGYFYALAIFFPLLFISFFANRVRARADKDDFYTLGDVIRKGIGPNSATMLGVFICGVCFAFVGANLAFCGRFLAELFGLSTTVSVIGVAVVVTLYLLIGGYKTVINTDFFQMGLMFCVFITLFFLIPDLNALTLNAELPPLRNVLGLVLLLTLSLFGYPDLWQRMLSVKQKHLAGYSMRWGMFVLVVLSIGMVTIGVGLKLQIPTAVDEAAFYQLLTTDLVPATLAAFLTVVMLAVAMSSIDTYTFAASSAIVRNILPDRFHDTRTAMIRTNQLMIIVIMAGLSLLAIHMGNIVDFIIKTATFYSVTAPLILYAIHFKPTSKWLDEVMTVSTSLWVGVFFMMNLSMGITDMLVLCLPTLGNAVCVGLMLKGRPAQV